MSKDSSILFDRFRIKPNAPKRYISKVTGYEVTLAKASEALLERLVKGKDQWVELVDKKEPKALPKTENKG